MKLSKSNRVGIIVSLMILGVLATSLLLIREPLADIENLKPRKLFSAEVLPFQALPRFQTDDSAEYLVFKKNASASVLALLQKQLRRENGYILTNVTHELAKEYKIEPEYEKELGINWIFKNSDIEVRYASADVVNFGLLFMGHMPPREIIEGGCLVTVAKKRSRIASYMEKVRRWIGF